MTLFRVEWTAEDHTGVIHEYRSHDMPQTDAEAMAATIRDGNVLDVAVIQSA